MFDSNAYPHLAPSRKRPRFTLTTKCGRSVVHFTVFDNDVMIDDLCGRAFLENKAAARKRWASMVARGWRPEKFSAKAAPKTTNARQRSPA